MLWLSITWLYQLISPWYGLWLVSVAIMILVNNLVGSLPPSDRRGLYIIEHLLICKFLSPILGRVVTPYIHLVGYSLLLVLSRTVGDWLTILLACWELRFSHRSIVSSNSFMGLPLAHVRQSSLVKVEVPCLEHDVLICQDFDSLSRYGTGRSFVSRCDFTHVIRDHWSVQRSSYTQRRSTHCMHSSCLLETLKLIKQVTFVVWTVISQAWLVRISPYSKLLLVVLNLEIAFAL